MSGDDLIAVLAADAFRSAYQWTSTAEQNVEAVVYASFSHPSAGVIDAYAKFYHPESRGMVNEITGWILAKACGLPVPSTAFIAMIPLQRLPQPLEGVARLAAANGRDVFPAFCTIDANPYGVPPIVDTQSLIDEIKRWRDLHGCVAFDEQSANADRHCKNLVRNGLRDFVLIDHGRLAWRIDAPNWGASIASSPLDQYANRLSAILWPNDPPKNDVSAIMLQGQNHREKTIRAWAELEKWVSILVPDVNDQDAWTSFLKTRSENFEALVSKRYNLLA